MVLFPKAGQSTGLCEEHREFSFGHGEFEVISAHPRGNVKLVNNATSLKCEVESEMGQGMSI